MKKLNLLAKCGIVSVTMTGGKWLVQYMSKDKFGFLSKSVSEWGDELDKVMEDLFERVETETGKSS